MTASFEPLRFRLRCVSNVNACSTVPFCSIRQSCVTVPFKSPKCHDRHGNFSWVPKSFWKVFKKSFGCHGEFSRLPKRKLQRGRHASRGLPNWMKWYSIILSLSIGILGQITWLHGKLCWSPWWGCMGCETSVWEAFRVYKMYVI
jgi:hypothetical protein